MPRVLGALFPDQDKPHAKRHFLLSGVPSAGGGQGEGVGVLVLSFVLLPLSQEARLGAQRPSPSGAGGVQECRLPPAPRTAALAELCIAENSFNEVRGALHGEPR